MRTKWYTCVLLVLCWQAVAFGQMTRSALPADMLGIPTTTSGVIYPITARTGAGSTCTAATLNAALQAIGPARATLLLPPHDGSMVSCTWTLEANVTVPETVHLLVAAPVVVGTGVTLTVSGPHQTLIGDLWYAGAGTVTFAQNIPLGTAPSYASLFQSYVVSGGLHGSSGSTTTPALSTRAWIDGHDALQTAATVTYTAGDGTYWLGMRRDASVVPAGWTAVAGTRYCWIKSTSRPARPAGVVLLSQAIVSGAAITANYDWRPDSPMVGATSNLRSPLFGAVADCATDDTAAVQAWINNAATRNVSGYAPAGCYAVQTLWLSYDSVENPNYPSLALDQGDTRYYGDRSRMKSTHVEFEPTRTNWPGTVFYGLHTSKPMINARGTGGTNPLRGLQLEAINMVQTTSSYVIDWEGANSYSGMKNLYVLQRGLGGGIRHEHTFLTWIDDSYVESDNDANDAIGIHIFNDDTAGGNIRLVNTTAGNFGTCIRLGTDYATATRLKSLLVENGQAIGCPRGIDVMGAGRGVVIEASYIEQVTEYAIQVSDNAQGVTLMGNWLQCNMLSSATSACVRIGLGSGGGPTGAKGVAVIGNVFLSDDTTQGYHLWRDVGMEVRGAFIAANDITIGIAMQAGIYCGTQGIQGENNLSITGNSFQGGGTNTIDATCRLSGEFIEESRATYMNRRVNFGQGSSLASAATITIPSNGNVYNLTGSATITAFDCTSCTPGAMIWFTVLSGNAPVINEGGNILLNDNATPTPNSWTGGNGAVIQFLYDGTNWREVVRIDD